VGFLRVEPAPRGAGLPGACAGDDDVPTYQRRRCVFSILVIILIVIVVLALLGFFGFRGRG
jgi:nitrate reductase NapE component